jgi:uncharacterized protein YlxW (UPF0749 family)
MKDKWKIALLLISIVLGGLLTVGLRTGDKKLDSNFKFAVRDKEVLQELDQLKIERDTLRTELENLESKIKSYEDSAAKENVIIDNIKKETVKYKMFAGFQEVQGKGVEITIEDPDYQVYAGEFQSTIINNYEYLMLIISYLNISGAEAISINGQRYTSYSEIIKVGTHLNINGRSVDSPIEIKAIGDPISMEAALNLKGGVIDVLKRDFDLKISILQKENLIIPKYGIVKNFRFATPVD